MEQREVLSRNASTHQATNLYKEKALGIFCFGKKTKKSAANVVQGGQDPSQSKQCHPSGSDFRVMKDTMIKRS